MILTNRNQTILLICFLTFGCSTQKFQIGHLEKSELCGKNCVSELQNEFPLLADKFQRERSIILHQRPNETYFSETDAKELHPRRKIPTLYSHLLKIHFENWIDYSFYILGDTTCRNRSDYSSYKETKEILSLYHETLLDSSKINFIKSVGAEYLNGNYNFYIYDPESSTCSIALSHNIYSVSPDEFDLKYSKYIYILTANKNLIDPLIYNNEYFIINFRQKDVSRKLNPIR